MSTAELTKALEAAIINQNLATKDDIKGLAEKMTNLASDNVQIKADVSALKSENRELRRQVESLEKRSRQDRISITGLAITDQNKLMPEISAFLTSLLDGNETVELRGVIAPPGVVIAGKQLIVAHLANEFIIPKLFKASSTRLQGTGIRLSRDMPASIRKRHNRMLRLRYDIKTKSGMKATVSYDHLFLEGRKFEWENDILVCKNELGAIELQKITGIDFQSTLKEIVEFKQTPRNK